MIEAHILRLQLLPLIDYRHVRIGSKKADVQLNALVPRCDWFMTMALVPPGFVGTSPL
jgi:hypothetical protein